jgi:hypothetical protein
MTGRIRAATGVLSSPEVRPSFAGASTGVGIGQPWRPFMPEPY